MLSALFLVVPDWLGGKTTAELVCRSSKTLFQRSEVSIERFSVFFHRFLVFRQFCRAKFEYSSREALRAPSALFLVAPD